MTRSAAAVVLLAGVLGCTDDPESSCPEDAGALPTVVRVNEGAACAQQRLSIPRRETLACGDLPGDFGGSRLKLAGHPDTRWTVVLERTDGLPSGVCAAALDERCGCALAQCTGGPAEPMLVMDLGTVRRSEMDIVIAAGTYSIELCTR